MRQKLSWKDMIDQGYVIAGSPATVRERLEYAIKELNTGHLMVLCQFGSMPPELARQNTELFAKDIMPHVRPLFNDWEDHWWPHPMAQTAQQKDS
jgi:alkanesulfonate monooxygenase SsuD/methylene tetrahydromethanopterin reductase-like flavin-dependent oxidoreductase (luciferase family)